MTSSPSSLRERSKARRRAAIQAAAFELFAEHGYDETTIADIAAAAEVSARSVSMYFPNKLDIAMSRNDEISGRWVEVQNEHPRADYLGVLDQWLRQEATLIESDLHRSSVAMFRRNPQLAAQASAQMVRAMSVGLPALAAQARLAEDDPMLGVMAGMMTAAISRYFAVLATDGFSEAFHQRYLAYIRRIVVRHGISPA